jgi:hypothetical protein
MVRIYARKAVNQPHGQVWKLLSDLESPMEYHPMVQSVDITSSNTKGIGASRTLYYVDGSLEKEEVVQVGTGSITFHRKSLDQNPETQYTLTYSVKKLSLTWTDIVMEAFYPMKMGVWQQIKRAFWVASTEQRLQMQFRQELDGIDYHLSTHKRAPKCSFDANIPRTKHSDQKGVVIRHHNNKAVGTI